MQKIKYLISALIFIAALVFIFGPALLPENLQFKQILASKPDADFIIIFNSGGWGDTPVEKAGDLTPVVRGIEKTLNDKGYKSLLVPYQRTEPGIFAKFMGSKEFFNYFNKQSREVADNIEIFLKNNPGKRVLLIGLSGGAAFANEIMKKIGNFRESVFAVEMGVPFWLEKFNSDNILALDNKDGDSLTVGEMGVLLPAFFSAPVKWVWAKIIGEDLPFGAAFDFSKHKYFWDSPEVGKKIVIFLDEKVPDKNF